MLVGPLCLLGPRASAHWAHMLIGPREVGGWEIERKIKKERKNK